MECQDLFSVSLFSEMVEDWTLHSGKKRPITTRNAKLPMSGSVPMTQSNPRDEDSDVDTESTQKGDDDVSDYVPNMIRGTQRRAGMSKPSKMDTAKITFKQAAMGSQAPYRLAIVFLDSHFSYT